MRKRLMCWILAALLLLGLLPGAAVPAAAVEIMTTSEACIDILKDLEGFLEYPVLDDGQYSVGYGSGCGKDDYPNGITVEEADALMRQYLQGMELQVNGFAQRCNIVLAQNQFDALMLFTYNCGSNWVNGDGIFRQAVIEGKTGNEFIYAMTLWSGSNEGTNMGLVKRRLIEADMYLNGSYTNKKPSNFTYVLLDANGGMAEGGAHGYDCNSTAKVLSAPTRSDYRFLGWYTAAEGGEWITELTAANAEKTIYAHWQMASGTYAEPSAASYQLTSDELDSLSVYSAPDGEVVSTLSQSAVVSIVGDYVDESGVKWGITSSGKWLRLGNPRLGASSEEEEEVGIEVAVTGTTVNVRSGPGTNYKIVSGVSRGDKLIITETRMVGNVLWGKFRAGWICLQYTSYTGGLIPEDPNNSKPLPAPEEDIPIATGTVTVESLNIRSTPGTNGYLMGGYIKGDKVTIFERAVAGGVFWGRTDKGWISLQYVLLDTQATTPTMQPTEPAAQPTEPSQNPEIPTEPQDGLMGTVMARSLVIRKAPGSGNAMVDTYPQYVRICVLEQKLHQGTLWGRTDKGWVCMTYVQLDPNSTDPDAGVKGMTTASSLTIRKGAGSNNLSVGSYARGTVVNIYEIKTVGKINWGRTDDGWVSMQYVSLVESTPVTPPVTTDPTVPSETTPTEPAPTDPVTPPAQTGVYGTVTASGLNIRSAANTGAASVGRYTNGQRIEILEQKMVNGMVWGRTDKGWVCMAYVQLDPNTQGNTSAGFYVNITASSLRIRSTPSTTGDVMGGYAKGEQVIILETRKVGAITWGRTDKGWISMQYVTDAVNTPVVSPEATNPTTPPATDPAPTEPAPTEPVPTDPVTPPAQTGVYGTVTASGLHIRSAANTGAASVGRYTNGQRIEILEQKMVNGMVWGRTDKGWVCMAYVQLDPNTQGNTSAGFYVNITASSLRIRSTPSTTGDVMGGYVKGEQVIILETRKVGAITWGRTDKGWISMQYVTDAPDAPAIPPVITDPTVPTEPAPTEPAPTEPAPTEPAPTEPAPTEPAPTEPAPTEPDPTEPAPTEPPAVEIPVAFGFTCEQFVTSFNSTLKTSDAVAKSIDSDKDDAVCYELAAISDSGFYGVVMYVELAEDGETVAGIVMVCDGKNEQASGNLAAFAVYAMMIVDNTITEANLQAMLSDPQTDADGNVYYLMQRESGEYAFILTESLFYFYAYPYAD